MTETITAGPRTWCPVELAQALTGAGYRVTPQRVAVYRYLLHSADHPTAEEIYRGVRAQFPMISPATVYNTLDLLVSLGLVAELGVDGPSKRYDGNPTPHLNLHCTRCGRIVDVPEPRLKALGREAAARAGFAVRAWRHVASGLCPECQAAGDAPPREGAGRSEPTD